MKSVHELAERIAGLQRQQSALAGELGAWRSSANGCRVRSQFCQGHGWQIEIDQGAPPLEIRQLPEHASEDLLSVQLAELEALHEQHPRFARMEPGSGQSEAVFINYPAQCFAVFLPCQKCGGFALDLPISASRWIRDSHLVESRLECELARETALFMLARFGGQHCAACDSAAIRNGKWEIGGEGAKATAWLDVVSANPGWQLWLPLGVAGHGVSLPLGLPPWAAEEEVDEQARRLAAESRVTSGKAACAYDWEESGDFDG